MNAVDRLKLVAERDCGDRETVKRGNPNFEVNESAVRCFRFDEKQNFCRN